jgi:hypothetical protein
MRRYVGPGFSMAASIAFDVSVASEGATTAKFGNDRIRARSSSIWCVAPSPPTLMPLCVA